MAAVEQQETITKDSVTIKVNAVLLRGMNDRDAGASTSAAASTPSC